MDVNLTPEEEKAFRLTMRIDQEMAFAIQTKKIMELLTRKYGVTP